MSYHPYKTCFACAALPIGQMCPSCLELLKLENAARYARRRPARRKNYTVNEKSSESAGQKTES
jgi:hypothetical protein